MKYKHLIQAAALALLTASSLQAAPPANDNFANAVVITGVSGTQASTNVEATMESGENTYGSPSIWYRWTAPSSGLLRVNTNGSSFDTKLYVATGSAVNALTILGSDDDGGEGAASLVSIAVTSGTTYSISLMGYSGNTGSTVLNWELSLPPANDNFASAMVLNGSEGTTTGNNGSASTESGEPGGGIKSMWYSWTAPQAGKVVFHTLRSEMDTTLHLYTGTALNSLSLVTSNGDYSYSYYGESLVKFTAVAGTTYRVRLSSPYAGTEGPMTLNWKMVSEPANNHFSNAQVITGVSGSLEADTFEASMEELEPDFYGDTRSIWYAWTAPFTGVVSFDMLGTVGFATLTVANNTELESLNIVSDSHDYPPTSTFPVTSGTVYRIRISTAGEVPVTLNWQQLTDFVPSVISVANATINTTESGPAAIINLVRNGGTTTGPVSCYITTLDGSANGADYSGTYTTVSFAEGATTASVNIPIYQDRRFEGEETFQVRLFAPSPGEAAFGLSLSTVNIADDEPFIPLKANYAGLVQVFPFDNAMTGQLRINATGNGSFTGSLILGGAAALPFSGSFNATGKASIPITRKTGGNVLLNLTYADNGNRIRAQVTAGGKTAEVQAWRIIFGGAVEINDKPFAFTTEVSISSIQPNAPKATGFLSVTVSPKGEVKIVGTLPDDTSFTAGGPLTGYDVFPLYVPLYGGKGCLSSDFMLNEGMQDSSAMAWHKPANSKDKIFPGGFTHLGYLNNSPYVFSKRTPIIGGVLNTQGAADFDASGPGLPAEGITQVFRLLEDNSIALPLSPQVKLTLKVAPGTGFLTGTFQRGTEKPTPFKGAVFQVFDYAAGFYLAPTGAGAAMTDGDIFIGPAF